MTKPINALNGTNFPSQIIKEEPIKSQFAKLDINDK